MISLPPKGSEAKKLGSDFAPLRVTAQALPNMTVQVAEGSFWTTENKHMEYIGGTSPTIAAPQSDAKWVLVTVTSTGMLNVVDGVASGTPDLPDASLYKNELPLSAIFVGDTTTAITSDMVYDLRPLWSIPPDSVSQTQLNDFATITYVDNQVVGKADTTGTPSPNFTLNAGTLSSNNAGIFVDRFGGPDVGIRYNETTLLWEFTNDGATWNTIGVSTGNYYTKVELDTGALDGLYYTQNQLNPLLPTVGVLDSRFYVQGDADNTFAPLGHTHTAGDISGLEDPVEFINGLAPDNAGNVELSINNLLDVTNAGPAESQVLVYRSSFNQYVNESLNLNDLTNVDTTAVAPNVGDVLVHSGSTFVNRKLVKNDISDFTGAEFLLTTNLAGDAPAGDGTPTTPDSNSEPQDVFGVKTFKDGIVIEKSLVITGGNTSIETTDLRVSDPYIVLNAGEQLDGVDGGTGEAGIAIDRGPEDLVTIGSPGFTYDRNAPAVLYWSEAGGAWFAGKNDGTARAILTGNHTHTSNDVLDFTSRVTTELGDNDLLTIKDVGYVNLADGDYLRRSTGNNTWENKSFATDFTTELGDNNLDQMADVFYTTKPPLVDEFLVHDGTNWNSSILKKAHIDQFAETDYIHTDISDEVKLGGLTIGGNFTTSQGVGTETRIESENLYISDSVIRLNTGEIDAGVGGGTGHGGFIVDRGTLPPAVFWWEEASSSWFGSKGLNTAGSPPTITQAEISFVGHEHTVSDISDLSVTAADLNQLIGITGNVQIQLDDKISRTGDIMNALEDLDMNGGEITGLPAVASVDDAATSKLYVDTEVARKIDRTGDTMDDSANLTFAVGGEVLGLPAAPTVPDAAVSQAYTEATYVNISGDTMDALAVIDMSGGEVIGLPATPSGLTAAVSQAYVDAHAADVALHLTTEQNAYIDGLNLPTLTSTESNQLIGISGNVQTLLDAKTDKVIPAIVNTFAALDGTGNLTDSGYIVNDAGITANDVWSADMINTTKADKLSAGTLDNFMAFDATGNIKDSTYRVNDANVSNIDLWSSQQIDDDKISKVPTAVVGNFATFLSDGSIADTTLNTGSFAPTVHTHETGDITDWATAFTTGLGQNNIAALGDVSNNAATTGDFLRWNGSLWDDVAPISINDFVHATGSVNETVTGQKTFQDQTFFQQDVSMSNQLFVGGNTVITGDLIVQGDQITQGDEILETNVLILNFSAPSLGSADGGGLSLRREVDAGSPAVVQSAAVLQWDENTGRWNAGILDVTPANNTIQPIALENQSVAQPVYDVLVGKGAASLPADATYAFAATIPAPAVGRAGLQLFVNGIKQLEGTAFTTAYNATDVTVVFAPTHEPQVGDNVEFYGFGFIG